MAFGSALRCFVSSRARVIVDRSRWTPPAVFGFETLCMASSHGPLWHAHLRSGVACVAAFRNQVHTGLPSEDPCSSARHKSSAMSGTMSSRQVQQFMSASEVTTLQEARKRSSGECGASSSHYEEHSLSKGCFERESLLARRAQGRCVNFAARRRTRIH